MEPIPAEELKAEKFPRISAEDLIELCELSGPSKAPNPAKSSKSSKPRIVVIDVRSEDEYPFHAALFFDTVSCHALDLFSRARVFVVCVSEIRLSV